MRSPNRRRLAALAALSAGVLCTAGCGGGAGADEAANVQKLYFESAGARGPAPFTPSTVSDAQSAPPAPSVPAATASAGTGKAAGAEASGRARTLPGSTPGLYGGTQGVSSCDVEREVRFLTENKARSVAFAKAAHAGGDGVPGFLRGLTPVVLRADTRVTSHGYHDGAPTAFQSVLQAGTAVLADGRGMPRVRCGCGNPLGPAVPMEGPVAHQGTVWHGYRPGRVLLISPAQRLLPALTVVDSGDNTWMDRATGTAGDDDRTPGVTPPYGPGADLFDPDQVSPQEPMPDSPSGSPSAAPTGATPPQRPSAPPVPTGAPTDVPTALPSGVPTDVPDNPLPSEEQAAPGGSPVPVAPQPADVLIGPDNGQG
ncbi:DUF6777 domain-containing protein [Streptomyces montanisoli]|uniref:DUF6777 domain-containing protein n=1 Tax=Streptomyces montanisoli TaxID=2798581 RepID=A0A940MJK0_9ACTN|nr:DUF6777 domain-containing protein [Streptomyces montanisoli]MBP0460902.1 hypothetical protein [Streptomyces montanisoli]